MSGETALRSQAWFDTPDNPGMTALYIERYMNWGLTREELQSGRPVIGIAQTGSDLAPCNRHHLQLADRVREGIAAAGGLAFEFPVHPIQETGRRPTAALDRNLHALPCIGDGRQSGTSGSPSILNASPEATVGGGPALLRTGDRVRIDLTAGTADVLLPEEDLAARRRALEEAGGPAVPASQTPWQEIQRSMVDQLGNGMVLRPAVAYQRAARTAGVPRENH
jgi:dihydroxyacid dehydratase/phosphogluconate dehydratase